MGINIARFYKREEWQLDCEIITPMFLGNSDQEAELRAAPFKGLLRYWWRVANGRNFAAHDFKGLLKKENEIFGSADDGGGKSQVTVAVTSTGSLASSKEKFKNIGKVKHPECEKSHHKTDPLNYLAGMGLIHFKNGILHSYFKPGGRFSLKINASEQAAVNLEKIIALLSLFGAIGSRSRNGWGCFSVNSRLQKADWPIENFTDALDRDYPHCLGVDSKGPLFWQTKEIQSSWEYCLKDLATIYIAVRAGDVAGKIPKLEVNSGSPPDRHSLGYPVTNHSVNKWGRSARHSSALRLLVRKEKNSYRGYFLHLPHLFSDKMWPNGKERQIKIWRQVHRNLDKLCDRVSLQGAK